MLSVKLPCGIPVWTMSKAFAAFLLILAVIAAPVAAQQQNDGRAAMPAEVIGAWELLPYPAGVAKEINRVNHWPQPFQYFLMLEDGRINWIMSRDRQELTRARMMQALERQPWSRYEMREGKMEVVDTAAPGTKQKWNVNIVMRDLIGAGIVHRKGDLVMSLDTGGGEVIYFRTLRKLPD